MSVDADAVALVPQECPTLNEIITESTEMGLKKYPAVNTVVHQKANLQTGLLYSA